MFDLFGSGTDRAARESLVNITGWLVGLGQLLVDKGLMTEDELLTAIARGKQQVDQKIAENRDAELERLKVEEPETYKTMQFFQKLVGDSLEKPSSGTK